MAEVAPLLTAALPLAPIQKFSTFPDKKELTELLRTFEPKVCFLDFASPGDGGFAMLEVLQAVSRELVVVALLPGNNPDFVLRCLRSGAADFLVAPFTADQVETVVEKVVRRLPAIGADGPPARLVAVVPVKGGAGATTIACNLASHCKRLGAERVLLADLDSLTGAVSFLLKLKSTYSFLDVLHHVGGLDSDIWKQMVTPAQGVDVLLAPDSVVDPTADLHTAAPILDFVRYLYDVIVADCGGVDGEWNLSITRAADEVLLITSNELPDLHAAQRAIVYLEANGIDGGKVRLVVNRYAEANGLGKDQISNALNIDIFQLLPVDDPALERSLMEGKPVPLGTSVGKSLAAMATQLLELEKPASSKRSGKPRLLSFLSRN